MTALGRYAPLTLAMLWAGMVLGVSFIATPAKFLAPSLSREVAFDVGRVTFHIFSAIEIVVALLLLLAIGVFFRRLVAGIVGAFLVAVVAGESLYLLPQLDLRVEAILNGETLAPSSLHTVYVALEACKLLALLGLAGYCVVSRPEPVKPNVSA